MVTNRDLAPKQPPGLLPRVYRLPSDVKLTFCCVSQQGLDLGSAFLDGDLAPRRPPGTLPKTYRAVVGAAAGHFQLLFWRRGQRQGQEPPRPRLRHRCFQPAIAMCVSMTKHDSGRMKDFQLLLVAAAWT